MDQNTKILSVVSLGDDAELARRVSDPWHPAARYYSVFKDSVYREDPNFKLVRDVEELQAGIYDRPLPFFGSGIRWFSFLLGFVCPLIWYYATFLYFGNYYRKEPRERAGLAASSIAALGCSVLLLIIAAFGTFLPAIGS